MFILISKSNSWRFRNPFFFFVFLCRQNKIRLFPKKAERRGPAPEVGMNLILARLQFPNPEDVPEAVSRFHVSHSQGLHSFS